MSYPNRTAFIISNPSFITEIMNQKPAVFRIFLTGVSQFKHPDVTSCYGKSFHDTAVQICQEMLQRRLTHIVSNETNRPLQWKVDELINGSCNFALSGAIENALENLWHNISFLSGSFSIDAMRNRFNGMPAIIAGSGPSLRKNIHLLNGLKENSIVISCGSALSSLRAHGITPHIAVVVDPNPAMYEVLKPHLDSPVCFLMSLMAQHRISQDCMGRRMYFPVNYDSKVLEDLKRFTGIQTVLPAMASVGTTAFFFALHAGFNPIIFIGMDLCYTDDRTHINGPATPEDACSLETVDGQQVRSSPALKEAFDFYADFIPTITDRKIINATEGGAGIRGAEHISLAETAARFLTNKVSFQEPDILTTNTGGWIRRLKELRGGFHTMHVKAAGFQRKIQTQAEKDRDASGVGARILSWFESLRTMAGYEYVAGYLDWVCYKAVMSDELEPKLELLDITAKTLQKQIQLLEGIIRKMQAVYE